MNLKLKEEAIERFKEDIYATETTRIHIDEVDIGYAKCSFSIERMHKNAADSVMGGAIFTLADFTFAVAANAGAPLTVSLNSQINYLGRAKGKELIAIAQCTKNGRTACFYQIDVMDELDNLVATVFTTGFHKV